MPSYSDAYSDGILEGRRLLLPTSASAVREVIFLAYRLGLKGVTVYRFESRPGQTFSVMHEEARRHCRGCEE